MNENEDFLKHQKVNANKKVYTLEAELFLSNVAEEDMANENEDLKQCPRTPSSTQIWF